MWVMANESLSRDAGVPLWRQVALRLSAEIRAGGDARLPSEMLLARRFGVNRHTVRQALRSLAEQGLVRAEQGRGTFVADLVVDYPIGPRTRFTASLQAQDLAPAREILGCDTLPASEAMAIALDVAPQTVIVRVRSLTFANGVPIALGFYHVALQRFPDALETFGRATSVTAVLAVHGIADYRRLRTRIIARAVDAGEAPALRLAPGAAVLVTEGVDVDLAQAPIAFTVSVWAADRVQLVVET
jgi:GntR family phosphonate transport system transcriptional regulator